MRVFALSDVHVDYDVNAKWVADLSEAEYRDDVLILAGDVSDRLSLLGWCLNALTARFRNVLFVPGNHDLWVIRDRRDVDSLQKLDEVRDVVESSGASMASFRMPGLSIIPLRAWYDGSFGEPSEKLRRFWMDYRACRWPPGMDEKHVSSRFAAENDTSANGHASTVITYSHFVPRIDVLPTFIPVAYRFLDPVLGTTRLEHQLRALRPKIHVYGHSHFNRRVRIDSVTYVNNALGYPNESRIAARRLVSIHEL
jgi:predicted phosphodiesterase